MALRNCESNRSVGFSIRINATSLITGTWVDADTLDFTTPTLCPYGRQKMVMQRLIGTAISATISGLNMENGATFWIRWTDF